MVWKILVHKMNKKIEGVERKENTDDNLKQNDFYVDFLIILICK